LRNVAHQLVFQDSHYLAGDAVLPKAFQNNGSNLAGVFIDKYQGSNCKPDGSGLANHSDGIGGTPLTGGIFASRPLHWPVSAVDIITAAQVSTRLSACAIAMR
jgi:hypothetical protein